MHYKFQKNNFLQNKKLQSSLKTNEGILMFSVVREFLEYFDLEFTLSVFEPESCIGSKYKCIGRPKLIEDLNIPGLQQTSPDPVLLQLIHLHHSSNKLSDAPNNENSISSLNYKNDLMSQSSDETKSTLMAANDYTLEEKSSILPGNAINLTFNAEENFEQSKDELPSSNSEANDYNSTKKSHLDMIKGKLLIDFDKNSRFEDEGDHTKDKSHSEHIFTETDFSPPIVKDVKNPKSDTSFDKIKLSSTKSDKIKVKNNLSPLSELPPLQISKSRTNDLLLPSLYTKEFRDKGNLREIDKLFDLEPMDNYEEDFMSESEIDLTLNKQECSKINISEELRHGDDRETVSIICEDNTGNSNPMVKGADLCAKKVDSNSTASSVTSDDFEISSNIDDILNSC